jgi:serine/threonine protein kinase
VIWHPNIIYVYKTFVESGLTFIVLEYCPSGAVSDLLLNDPFSPDQLYGTTHQIVSALQACHPAKIAHGDLKPQNILISKTGRVKLADFRLAIVWSSDLLHQFKGSFDDIVSEVLRYAAFDPFKADIWSLWITLYKLAARRLLLPPDPHSSEFYDHIRRGLRDIDAIVPVEYVGFLQALIVVPTRSCRYFSGRTSDTLRKFGERHVPS